MSTTQPANQRLIFGNLVFSLAALCLLLNLAGVARLAYDIVVVGYAANLLVKVLILVLVFVFGLGLGTLSRRRFHSPAFPLFARVYTWAYLALLWVTYLGITLQINTQRYSFLQYLSFLFLIGVELFMVLGLRLAVPDQTIGLAAVPMLAIVLFHLLLIVYKYVFASQPVSAYLAGDLLFMFSMAVVSSAMLGENAFRAFIERLIEKVG